MCVAEWVEQCAGVSQVRRRHKENEFDVVCTDIDRFDLLVKVLLVFANQTPDSSVTMRLSRGCICIVMVVAVMVIGGAQVHMMRATVYQRRIDDLQVVQCRAVCPASDRRLGGG